MERETAKKGAESKKNGREGRKKNKRPEKEDQKTWGASWWGLIFGHLLCQPASVFRVSGSSAVFPGRNETKFSKEQPSLVPHEVLKLLHEQCSLSRRTHLRNTTRFSPPILSAFSPTLPLRRRLLPVPRLRVKYLLMSPTSRVTRSSTRQAASQAASSSSTPAAAVGPPSTVQTPAPASRRKRKTHPESSPAEATSEPPPSARRSKRPRVAPASTQPLPPPAPLVQAAATTTTTRRRKGKAPATMSSPEYVSPLGGSPLPRSALTVGRLGHRQVLLTPQRIHPRHPLVDGPAGTRRPRRAAKVCLASPPSPCPSAISPNPTKKHQ